MMSALVEHPPVHTVIQVPRTPVQFVWWRKPGMSITYSNFTFVASGAVEESFAGAVSFSHCEASARGDAAASARARRTRKELLGKGELPVAFSTVMAFLLM